ncbi:MAG: gliding motility-associated C-terminal domain-containing protein [Saprospiraceae bacterium]
MNLNKPAALLIMLPCMVLMSWVKLWSQCAGLVADAGPDMLSCDSSQMLQLQGSIQGNYTKFYWTPSTGLDNPNSLNPMVLHKGKGTYTYKLTAEGISTTNLVVNGNFESGNTGFSSGYTYTSTNTTEGEYYVTNNPQSWNGGFSPCGDHTTGSGNMLLLNGHPVAGTNFWCQNIPTVAGRMYQLEFWSQSVVAFNIAQIGIKINGITVGSTQAGGLCNWVLYTITFTATGASTQICLNEVTGIRAGNDFAVDDIAVYEKCVSMDDVTVEIINLVAKLDIIKKPRCSSDPFDLTGIGSSTGPDIKYEWSTDVGRILSTNGLNAKGLGPGIYTLKVTYSKGNVSCQKEALIEVTAPENLSGIISLTGKLDCRHDSVQLSANILTGTGTYSYKWSPDSLILKGKNSADITVKSASRYSLVVTDLNSGCTLTMNYDVPADTVKPSISIDGDSLLSCRSNKIKLYSTLKDSQRYQLTWIRPSLDSLKGITQISDSTGGWYQLYAEDVNNHCKDSVRKYINLDTSHPKLSLGGSPLINCRTDSTLIRNIFDNLNGKYSYQWIFNGQKFPSDSVNNPQIFHQGGTVKLEITNQLNGCKTSDSLIILKDQNIPKIDAGLTQTITCRTTSVVLTARHSPADSIDIIWTTTGGNISGALNRDSIIADRKGWYQVNITDQRNGCSQIDSVFVDEDTRIPTAPILSDLIFHCHDTIVLIDASSASNGTNIIYTWSTINGKIISGQNTSRLSVGTSGDYLLVLTDTVNGCSDSSRAKVLPDLDKPMIRIDDPDTLSCKKIAVDLQGVAMSPSGHVLLVQWKDSKGNNIAGQDSSVVSVSKAGVYTFYAQDINNGCFHEVSINVLIDTLRPLVNTDPDQVWNCLTKSLNLSANTSLSNIVYQWNTIGGKISGAINQNKIQAASPGMYICRVSNPVNGCENLDTTTLLADTTKPIISVNAPDTITCNINSVQLNCNSSNPNLNFEWRTMNGLLSGATNQINSTAIRKGTYQISVTDTSNFCEASDSILVIEDKAPPVINIQAAQDLTCNNHQSRLQGIITSTGNYLLVWNTNDGHLQTNADINPAVCDKPGKYYLSVTNLRNGCRSEDSVIVIEKTNYPAEIHYRAAQPPCYADQGIITIDSITGGDGAIKIELDQAIVKSGLNIPVNAGQHVLKVTDQNGCTLIRSFNIDTIKAISVSLPAKVSIQRGTNYQLLPVYSIPIDSIFSISWNPSDNLSCSDCTQPIITGLTQPIRYTVIISDQHGCNASASIDIEILGRDVWVPNTFSPNGDNVNDFFYPIAIVGSYLEVQNMSIFDRWGNKVFDREHFQPNDPLNGWNGTFRNQIVNPGVYAYILEIKWLDGSSSKLSGDVTLTR